jgi:hypothetical protein
MIENPEEIILDSTNNVFVGPNGYFKIVIDQFDGTSVKAWHIEDSKGNKTVNLADRAQGKHIDVMVNGGNRTVAHFVDRYQADILKYQQSQIQKLSAAANAAPAAKDAPAPAPAAKSTGVPVSVPIGIAVVAIAIIAYQASRNKGNKNDSSSM